MPNRYLRPGLLALLGLLSLAAMLRADPAFLMACSCLLVGATSYVVRRRRPHH